MSPRPAARRVAAGSARRPPVGRIGPWAGLAATLLAAGCASPGDSGPRRALLETPVQALGAAPALADTATPWPDQRWWQAFGDPALDRLVDQALAGQPSLQTAQSRLQQAQAAVELAGSARQPQVNASVDLSDQRFTENGLVPRPLAGSMRWNNNAQVTAGWELDLFGRQRAALEAAIGQQRAAQADAQAARVLLAAQVTSGWFNLARLVEAQALAGEALQQREQLRALLHQRVQAGLDSASEQHQADGQVAQARGEREALAEALGRARHALAELSGQPPQALADLAPRLPSVPPGPPPAPRTDTPPAPSTAAADTPAAARATPTPGPAPLPGSWPPVLPADLLGRRADLVAQRWRVEASRSDVAAARALFYPNLNLVAFVGLSSIGLDRFIEAGARTYGAGPALRLPIFDGGRLRANLDSRSAEADAAVDAYNATLLRALREVADELASLDSLTRQQRAQQAATAAAEAGLALARQRLDAGLGNRLPVLAAQGHLLAQRRAANELQGRWLVSQVALARALGGGFDSRADSPVASTSSR